MKIILILLILFSSNVYAQNNKLWIENFKAFRNSHYNHENEKLCEYFDFPIKNSEIWELAKGFSDNNLLDNKIPFEKKDFLKYSSTIFTNNFINSIQKVKTAELYKKGKFETVQIRDKDTIYQMNINYSKVEKMLTISLYSEYPFSQEDGEGNKILEKSEFSIIYEIRVLPSGQIKFKKVIFAG